MKFKFLKTALVGGILTCSCLANAGLIGSSSTDAGLSMHDILVNGGSIGDGIYWIDPDGLGGDVAFQAYGDMTTDGGGWTLGLNSLFGNVAASTDMVQNTGTVGLSTAHTRDLEHLAILDDAQLRHVLSRNGSVVFDGYYTGNYHGTFEGNASNWTIFTGSIDIFGPHQLGNDWSTITNDVDDYSGNCASLYNSTPWYYGRCWTSHPGYENIGEPSAQGRLDSWEIYVRDNHVSNVTDVPEPSTLTIFALGMIGLASRRFKKQSL